MHVALDEVEREAYGTIHVATQRDVIALLSQGGRADEWTVPTLERRRAAVHQIRSCP